MGAGLSLSHAQVVQIIENDLQNLYAEEENMRPRTTDDGYEIHYDFTGEVLLRKRISELKRFLYDEQRTRKK